MIVRKIATFAFIFAIVALAIGAFQLRKNIFSNT